MTVSDTFLHGPGVVGGSDRETVLYPTKPNCLARLYNKGVARIENKGGLDREQNVLCLSHFWGGS